MADFTLRYADFKGGDYGLRDPSKVDADTFHGLNVTQYRSGILGVRAGIKPLTVTGLPNHPIVPGPLGFWAKNNGNLVIFLDKPYEFPAAGGAAIAWTAYPDNPSPSTPVRFVSGAAVPYSLCNGKLYKHLNPATTTPITTPEPLSHITRWGQFFVGVSSTTPWRIWYSTVDASGAHFDQWSANAYYDVGTNEPITALAPMLNTLYIGKRTGWNALSGVPGVLASIRGVSLGLGPKDPRTTAVTTDFRIIYWPIEPRPAWFNGLRSWTDTELDVGVQSSPFTCDSVIVAPTLRRLLMANDSPDGTEMLTWAGNSWSRHPWMDRAWTRAMFPAKVAGFAPAGPGDGGMLLPPDVIYAVLAPHTIGDPVVIGSYQHGLDRPGHVGDTYAAPNDMGTTDAVSGNVSFPAYWEPIGRQVQVRAVIVQFRKWNCGMPDTRNEIQLRVDSLGAYGRGVTNGQVAFWDEPCTRASSDGTDDSWRAGIGEQGWGNGFQINITKMTGIAIREIIVLCNVRTDRA